MESNIYKEAAKGAILGGAITLVVAIGQQATNKAKISTVLFGVIAGAAAYILMAKINPSPKAEQKQK